MLKQDNRKKYDQIHHRINRLWVKTGVCELCKERKKTEWSSKNHSYELNRNQWQEVCRLCHRDYDRYLETGVWFYRQKPYKDPELQELLSVQ